MAAICAHGNHHGSRRIKGKIPQEEIAVRVERHRGIESTANERVGAVGNGAVRGIRVGPVAASIHAERGKQGAAGAGIGNGEQVLGVGGIHSDRRAHLIARQAADVDRGIGSNRGGRQPAILQHDESRAQTALCRRPGPAASAPAGLKRRVCQGAPPIPEHGRSHRRDRKSGLGAVSARHPTGEPRAPFRRDEQATPEEGQQHFGNLMSCTPPVNEEVARMSGASIPGFRCSKRRLSGVASRSQ